MKIRRYKKVHKNISFYINNYGFRQPYQLLIDTTFCFTALQHKINIADNIPRYLQAETKLLTTQCVIIETESLGPKLSGALHIVKQYHLHKCGHEGKPIPASKCLVSMVGSKNDSHYVIATQDRELQNKLRKIPGVPLLYLHQKTPVLEQPSEASVNGAKMGFVSKSELERISELKDKHGIVDSVEAPKRKKKKGGPNPLSCKKKKKAGGVQNPAIKKVEAGSEIQKQQRKKLRIAQHIKQQFLKLNKKVALL